MEVIYVLSYHCKVKSEDIPLLSPPLRMRIQSTILSKLTKHPEIFGKPLRGSLKNYRSLRVGEYRVVYRLQNQTVVIVMIAHRSVVYEEVVLRFGL